MIGEKGTECLYEVCGIRNEGAVRCECSLHVNRGVQGVSQLSYDGTNKRSCNARDVKKKIYRIIFLQYRAA